MVEERIGTIVHYWPRAQAAQVRLEGRELHQGDRVRIRGHGHDLVQEVDSIQIDHGPRESAAPGEPAAIHVESPVHEKDEVFLIRDEG